jgi:hypothetical protein
LKETKLQKASRKFDLGVDLPEDYFIPLNFVGVGLLKSLAKKCKQISVFDYGFDVFYLPPEMWNMNAARKFGGQITADLNFMFVKNELEKAGLGVKLEKQFEFIEGYCNYKKSGKNKTNIVEDDYFYHLSVSR